MKIGIVTEYFYPTIGGITENVYHFALELFNLGHDFRIITPFAGDHGNIDRRVIEKVIHVGRGMPVFFNSSCGRVSVGFGLAKKFKAVLESEKFDVLHLHSPQFPTLPLLASMYQTCAAVGTFHTCATPHFYHKIYNGWARTIIERLAACIAVSDVCAVESKQCYGGSDYVVVPNGVDVSWWQQKQKRPEIMSSDFKWVVFLGRPDRRNGLDVIIDAMRIVLKQNKKVKLLVCGDGPLLFYYKKMAASLGEHVVFAGRQSDARPAFLQHADAMCFLPDIASFGITVLEGMASLCPLVASDIGPFRSLVRDEKDALLVPPHSAQSVAGAIMRILDDPTFAKSLAESAGQRVLEYDWSKVAQKTLNVFESVIRS